MADDRSVKSRYEGGGTIGGKWGCAIAAIIGVPLGAFLLLVDSLGDCVPGAACHKGFWLHVAVPVVVIALPLGLLVRWVVNSIARRSG